MTLRRAWRGAGPARPKRVLAPSIFANSTYGRPWHLECKSGARERARLACAEKVRACAASHLPGSPSSATDCSPARRCRGGGARGFDTPEASLLCTSSWPGSESAAAASGSRVSGSAGPREGLSSGLDSLMFALPHIATASCTRQRKQTEREEFAGYAWPRLPVGVASHQTHARLSVSVSTVIEAC